MAIGSVVLLTLIFAGICLLLLAPVIKIEDRGEEMEDDELYD